MEALAIDGLPEDELEHVERRRRREFAAADRSYHFGERRQRVDADLDRHRRVVRGRHQFAPADNSLEVLLELLGAVRLLSLQVPESSCGAQSNRSGRLATVIATAELREFASKGGAGRANELQLACQLFASFELLKDVKNF